MVKNEVLLVLDQSYFFLQIFYQTHNNVGVRVSIIETSHSVDSLLKAEHFSPESSECINGLIGASLGINPSIPVLICTREHIHSITLQFFLEMQSK